MSLVQMSTDMESKDLSSSDRLIELNSNCCLYNSILEESLNRYSPLVYNSVYGGIEIEYEPRDSSMNTAHLTIKERHLDKKHEHTFTEERTDFHISKEEENISSAVLLISHIIRSTTVYVEKNIINNYFPEYLDSSDSEYLGNNMLHIHMNEIQRLLRLVSNLTRSHEVEMKKYISSKLIDKIKIQTEHILRPKTKIINDVRELQKITEEIILSLSSSLEKKNEKKVERIPVDNVNNVINILYPIQHSIEIASLIVYNIVKYPLKPFLWILQKI